MNANRNMTIDFMINGKHDHYIRKKSGKKVPYGATKKRRKG